MIQLRASRHCLRFSEILDGKSPMDANFDVTQMRKHVISCLKIQHLSPFPKALKEEH